MENQKIENPIELRTEEIDAILGRAPSGLIRNGMMVIFGVMALMLCGAYFFSYPDVIHSRVLITSSNPPVHLIAQSSGRIQSILVTDQQAVNEGQLLAILENPVNITTYTFLSPFDGVVSFANIWAANQSVVSGERVMSVLPANVEKIIGRMEIPVAGAGKIGVGQQVLIKLDNYPFMEFGIIKGVITSISLIPVNNAYVAVVELPDGLLSNYGNVIPFNQEMGGAASIILEDMSLFERFLQPIRSTIKRK